MLQKHNLKSVPSTVFNSNPLKAALDRSTEFDKNDFDSSRQSSKSYPSFEIYFSEDEINLVNAVKTGDIESVNKLLKLGVRKDFFDYEGNTPIMSAIIYGQSEVVKELINSGANIDAVNKDGNTALILAAYKNQKEAAKILIENGANIEAKNKDGLTALIINPDFKEVAAHSMRESENQYSSSTSTMSGAAMFAGAAGATYLFKQQRDARIARENENIRRQRLKGSEEQLLTLLQETISPFQELLIASFGNQKTAEVKKHKGEPLLSWKADETENQLNLAALKDHRFKDEVRRIFTNAKGIESVESIESGEFPRFFSFNQGTSSIVVSLEIESKNCPIQEKDGNFLIRPEFQQLCKQIKQDLIESCKDEKNRVVDLMALEDQKNRDAELKAAKEKEIADEKKHLADLREKLQATKKENEKVRFQKLIAEQETKITKLDANFKDRLLQEKEEISRLEVVQKQNEEALAKKREARQKKQENDAIDATVARHDEQFGVVGDTENLAEKQAGQTPPDSPRSDIAAQDHVNQGINRASSPHHSPRQPKALSPQKYKPTIDIGFWQEMLFGFKTATTNIDIQKNLTSLAKDDKKNFLLENRSELRRKFNQHKQDFANGAMSEAIKDLGAAKQEFHQMLDKAINVVAGEKSSSNRKIIRDRIYFLLNYCASDEEACKQSFILTENEGKFRGARTGLGHAGGNNLENLNAHIRILSEFQPSKDHLDYSGDGLHKITTADLLKFQEDYWKRIPGNDEKKMMVVYRREEKSDFEHVKFLVENLDDPRFSSLRDAANEVLQEFVVNNSFASLQEGEKAISKEEFADFLKQEQKDGYSKLHKLVEFAEDFDKRKSNRNQLDEEKSSN